MGPLPITPAIMPTLGPPPLLEDARPDAVAAIALADVSEEDCAVDETELETPSMDAVLEPVSSVPAKVLDAVSSAAACVVEAPSPVSEAAESLGAVGVAAAVPAVGTAAIAVSVGVSTAAGADVVVPSCAAEVAFGLGSPPAASSSAASSSSGPPPLPPPPPPFPGWFPLLPSP